MPANVAHIISALRALTGELSLAAGDEQPVAPRKADREQAVASATLIAQCRKRRARFHPEYFFGEPCWDMLLDLFIANETGKKLTVTHLCTASQVPYGTALRYIGRLEARGDIVRAPDARDQRRCFVSITPAAADRMVACLTDMADYSGQQGYAIG
jgi:hypothetical protein